MTTNTCFCVILALSGILATRSSHHNHKPHKKHDVTSVQSQHISPPQLKVNGTNNTRRSIWDTINNANITVENHVHSYTTKSDVGKNSDKKKDVDPTRRNIWDAINNANITVENHVHSYTTKSDINKQATVNSTRRGIWDLIRNANITIQNSVHSHTVRKSKFHHSKPHAGGVTVREGGSLLRPMKVVEVTGQKRDEEPTHVPRGLTDDDPGPGVSVRGKSPSDVAE